MESKIRVLVVDDSALVRKMLSDMLNQHPQIEVVGTAQDGSFVLQKIKLLNPDVVTLDVEMRQTGGLEILPEIVQQFGLPVIMVSAHTERGANATMKALELGAVDFVNKPHALGGGNIQEVGDLLARKILAVAQSKRWIRSRIQSVPAKPTPPPVRFNRPVPPSHSRITMIAIGASTGGTEAIKDVLVNLPDTLPGIVIVQHMPAGFTKAFSNRLDGLCKIRVKEAEDGDPVQTGTALIAPGSHHMEIVGMQGSYRVRLSETPPVNRHRPSVDVLFHSVAQRVGNRALGVILTGMGGDGSLGLLAMREQGSTTVAQDEESCVVFGMPKEAIKVGGATYVMALNQIAPFLVDSVQR
ncbi:MAG: chemotaxis response regulator protein-glutamate methylesterase [bacterium]|jgi:two-component system chemotaxis response regulator CheB|nr:chemotaxis response regulator protein-glutamate methylesterase [bacterium]